MKFRKRLSLYVTTPLLAGSLLGGIGFASHKKNASAASPAQTQAAASGSSASTAQKSPAASTSRPDAGEIASAKAKGMVWVNTESKVYHTGGRYYGKTSHGKFMSMADAQRAGYKAAKR